MVLLAVHKGLRSRLRGKRDEWGIKSTQIHRTIHIVARAGSTSSSHTLPRFFQLRSRVAAHAQALLPYWKATGCMLVDRKVEDHEWPLTQRPHDFTEATPLLPTPADTKPTYWRLARHFWADHLRAALANVMDAYEFGVYAYVSNYIAAAFFHGSLSASWLVFGLSFLARPVGGLVFGVVADRCGRRIALLMSLYVMFGATVGQGLAPNLPYVGPACIVLCRVLQGLGVSGELGSLAVMLAESAPRPVLGQTGALLGASGAVGFFMAVGVTTSVSALLGPEQTLRWGWRLSFLFAAGPGALALYCAHATRESRDFVQAHKGGAGTGATCGRIQQDMAALVDYWPAGVLANAGGLTSHCMLYLTAYLEQWLTLHCGMSNVHALAVVLAVQGVSFVLQVPLCVLADTYGLAKTNVCMTAIALAAALPMYASLLHSPDSPGVVLLAGVVVPGVCLAGTGSKCLLIPWASELFPFEIRGSGFSLHYNFGAVLGGLTPFVCSKFVSTPLFPAYFAMAVNAVSLTAFVASWALHRAHQTDPRRLRVVHLRTTPY